MLSYIYKTNARVKICALKPLSEKFTLLRCSPCDNKPRSPMFDMLYCAFMFS